MFTVLFLGLIGHIGPTLFTMLVFMMACAFFQHADGPIINYPQGIETLLVLAASLHVSHLYYIL